MLGLVNEQPKMAIAIGQGGYERLHPIITILQNPLESPKTLLLG